MKHVEAMLQGLVKHRMDRLPHLVEVTFQRLHISGNGCRGDDGQGVGGRVLRGWCSAGASMNL